MASISPAGRLVAPFPRVVPLESNCYVLSSEPGAKRAIVDVFRLRLLGEAGARIPPAPAGVNSA